MSCEDQAESLLDSANDTAKLVRSVHLTFMLVMAYIAIIIGSTTDVQLLKLSPVTLPLLNVKLPILEFYVLTPWLLLLLHFNLLLQSYLLARKLHLFNATLDKCNDEAAVSMRDRLFTFALSQNIVGLHHSSLMRFFLNSIIVFSIVIVPLVLLTWAQVRFIPYHSEAITWSHRVVILLDCLLLWIIWPMIILPEDKLKQWVVQNMLLIKKLLGKSTVTILAKDKISLRGRGQRSLLISSVSMLFISWLVAVQPSHNDKGEKVNQFILTKILFELPGKPFRQDIYIENKILLKGEPSAKIEAALKGDNRDEKIKVLKEVVGLSLEGRDLRFATFEKCVMPKVIMANAMLQGAKLNNSFLHEANFLSAKLYGVQFINSNLQRSNLTDSKLGYAQIINSDLNLANLSNAFMEGVVLSYSKLIRANLSGARLKGAHVVAALLIDANLQDAVLDEGVEDSIHAHSSGPVMRIIDN